MISGISTEGILVSAGFLLIGFIWTVLPFFEPTQTKKKKTSKRTLVQADHAQFRHDYDQVLAALRTGREQFVDVRSIGRFNGTEPEPREGLPSGHAPGTINLPFTRMLDMADKTMLPADEIKDAFADAGIDLDKPMLTSCGSGVTACILSLGLYLIGKKEVPVFDGSWTEWAGNPDSPIESS